MLVRPATPADVPAVLPMVTAICAMHEAADPARYPMLPDVVQRYERWLPQRALDSRSVFLVAEEEGRIAGFLIGTVERNIPIYRLEEFGFIHDMWVEPEFRRRGLARGLVLAAVERFRALGVTQVRLETAAGNEAARRLFASCGFRVGTIDMLRELS
jgi:ribosomal protein S18 acetylase RimI-like enzyme